MIEMLLASLPSATAFPESTVTFRSYEDGGTDTTVL
jgi:hypothetical protein